MVHTKDGSRVVREFIAQGTAKVNGFDVISIFYLMVFVCVGPETYCQDDQASRGTHVR